MKWPAQEADLVAAGYVFDPTGSICRGPSCTRLIRWAITPSGSRQPFSEVWDPDREPPLKPTGLQPHHIDCPDAQRFRRKR